MICSFEIMCNAFLFVYLIIFGTADDSPRKDGVYNAMRTLPIDPCQGYSLAVKDHAVKGWQSIHSESFTSIFLPGTAFI